MYKIITSRHFNFYEKPIDSNIVFKEPHLKELYRHGTFNGGQPPEVMKMFTDSIRQFTDTVSKWEELDRK